MDKNTLSNYGWIVIAVLVLSVMIALATPFGEYIKAGVESTTAGLFDTSEKALNVVGMSAKEQPKQLWSSNWTCGKALSITAGKEGQLFNSSSHCISDYIEVKSGSTYALQCDFDVYQNKDLRVFYFAENKECVGYEIKGFSYRDIWIFTVPENASLIRFDIYRDGGLETELKPTDTKLYDVAQLQRAGYTNAGETLLSFGDSIAQGCYKHTRSYVYQIASNKFMDAIQKGNGGATFRVIDGNTNNILNQVNNADASLDPKFILINGLTNDAKPLTDNSTVIDHPELLGTISAGLDAELDTSTFCGAFETTIKTIAEKWPNAKIIYITTHINYGRDLETQDTLTELALEMCEKWNVPVADIYHDSGLDTFDIDMRNTYINDGSHPNTLGYKTFYVPLIESKMNDLDK